MARRKKGQGAIFKRGERFVAKIRIDGQSYWKTFDRSTDAASWIATVKSDKVRGVLRVEEKPADKSFVDLCRLYKRHKLSRWRPGMVRYFDGHLKTTLLPLFGERAISTIKPGEIQEFLDTKLQVVSGSTVNKYHQVLTSVFSYAVRMQYIDRSPMEAVERAVESPKEGRPVRPHELVAFLAKCDLEDRCFFTILFFCGLRESEIYRMRWDWVDLENEILHVKIAKRKSSKIPMAQPVKDAFMRLGPAQDGHVFRGRSRTLAGRVTDGPSKQVTTKKTILRNTLRRAGLDMSISFHSFRHGFITALEEVGVPYGVYKMLARHGSQSGDVTARYLHPTDEQLRAALASLVERVLGAPGAPVELPPAEAPADVPVAGPSDREIN